MEDKGHKQGKYIYCFFLSGKVRLIDRKHETLESFSHFVTMWHLLTQKIIAKKAGVLTAFQALTLNITKMRNTVENSSVLQMLLIIFCFISTVEVSLVPSR